MFNDGPPLQGRFIKNKDKIIKKLSISEFSFEEIDTIHRLATDNTNRTIVHAKLHEREEMDSLVHPPGRIDESLVDPLQKPPILQPIDFTSDWAREKRKWRKRAAGLDDDEDEDDDSDYDWLGVKQRKADEKKKTEDPHSFEKQEQSEENGIPQAYQKQSPRPDPAPDKINGGKNSEHTPINKLEEILFGGDAADSSLSGDEKMKIMGESIQKISRQDTIKPTDPEPQISEQKPEDFIAMDLNNKEGFSIEENKAIEKYKQQQAEEQYKKQHLETLVAEAKASGYNEGFKFGEEKAALQNREKAKQIFSKLDKLLKEFSTLKKDILLNIQDNFYELCQAMAEALLQREFKIDKAAFASIIRKAVEDSTETDEFKIRLNPVTYQELSVLSSLGDLKNRLIKDESIEPGDFKIESKQSTVSSNAKKVIAALLEQADIKLFEMDKKAS